ncbi:MAG TPA: hypothetical protein VEC37_06950, partial [Bacillota bacterium]|nr:hypothetical protein [Bacillota bacterium]
MATLNITGASGNKYHDFGTGSNFTFTPKVVYTGDPGYTKKRAVAYRLKTINGQNFSVGQLISITGAYITGDFSYDTHSSKLDITFTRVITAPGKQV